MMMPPMTAPMSDPPPLPYCPRCRTAARRGRRRWPATVPARPAWRRRWRVRSASHEVGSASWPAPPRADAAASASRVRASGPMLPRRVSMKSDTPFTRDCAVNNAWSNARLSRSAASRSSATLASSRSSSASALVSRVNAPSGSLLPALLRVGHRGSTAASRAAVEFGSVRRVALLQLSAGLVDAVLDVGDRRRQRGDRAVDVGRRAVDGVQQRAGLAERRLRGRGSRRPTPSGRPAGRCTRPRALVMFWSANASRCLAVSTLSATEVSAVASNWLCSAASACSDRSDPGGEVDHLLGERVQPARRVDDQVTQLVEGLASARPAPGRPSPQRRPPGSADRGAAAASRGRRRRGSGGR